MNKQLFKYQSPEEAGGRWIWGWVSPLYYPGGYIADIPYGAGWWSHIDQTWCSTNYDWRLTFYLQNKDSNITLNNLFNNRWIDGQTRTVIVNINTYNPRFFVFFFFFWTSSIQTTSSQLVLSTALITLDVC